MKDNLIRFDWAIKRLLRQKANFVVLEGLLSVLLEEDIRIERILESEGNQETYDDKFNRVDILAENANGELIIVEVQNNRELDYFHRMLYGTSKIVTEYIKQGETYGTIRKVYSVNIVYFDLGQGKDYAYHGKTTFKGIHYHDLLQLSHSQQKQFLFQEAGEIFPEYYILRVDRFNQLATTPLEQWVSFLKTGEIPAGATAKGLPEARERLRVDRMDEADRVAYHRHMEALTYQASVIGSTLFEGREEGISEGIAIGLAKGREEGLAEGERLKQLEIARNLKSLHVSIETIIEATGLSGKEINEL